MTSDQLDPSANSPWTRTTFLARYGAGVPWALAPGAAMAVAAPISSEVVKLRRSIFTATSLGSSGF
jgi:hypothetical protein